MTSSVGAETRKRKRMSKNKKKSWRKTDIADVEDHLDDQRLQERTGGLVAEKTNDQLFFVDTAVEGKDEPVSKRPRGAKPLRCHSLLEPDANIKPSRVKHNVRQEGLHRRCTAVQAKVISGALSVTEKRAQQQSTQATQKRTQRCKINSELPVVRKDLWAEEVKDPKMDEWYLKQTKRTRKTTLAHHGVKTSVLASVEVPHPGSSYNPTYADHQDLLQKALDVEIQKEKKEMRIKRAVDDKIPKITAYQLEAQWISEMSAGLADRDLQTTGHNEGSKDDDRLSVNPPVRREDKKTERQRRKEKERRLKARLVQDKKRSRIKNQEMFRLKRIKTEVKQRLATVEKQTAMKASAREQKMLRPRKLGKLRYQEADLEIKLSDELPGSLRQLKPEGGLMADRFKSLQRRNIIESRDRAKFVRRYKTKTYTKKSHKAPV